MKKLINDKNILKFRNAFAKAVGPATVKVMDMIIERLESAEDALKIYVEHCDHSVMAREHFEKVEKDNE